MRHRLVLPILLVVPCALLFGGTAARSHQPGVSGGYHVELIGPDGRPCPTTRHGGTTWVAGDYGSRYSLRVRNGTSRWVEAVMTVDGRDVVNGSAGRWSNRGYLVAPWETIEVDGFRVSDREVATFRFTSVPDSYAGRVGAGENAGVIGVAFFPGSRGWDEGHYRPRPAPEPWFDGRRSDKGESAGEAAPDDRVGTERKSKPSKSGAVRRPAPRQNLGTRFGERRWSEVTEVDFTRSHPTHPAAVLKVRYDDASGLRARGIPVPVVHTWTPPPRRYTPPPPDPFPAR